MKAKIFNNAGCWDKVESLKPKALESTKCALRQVFKGELNEKGYEIGECSVYSSRIERTNAFAILSRTLFIGAREARFETDITPRY